MSDIDIIYRDQHIIALNKPHGLLSVPGLGPDKQDCLINRLLETEPRAKVVHRLDCHTSGIMVFAIDIDMQRAMSRLFHDRHIDKHYLAVVAGWVDGEGGVIRLPLRCDIDNRPRHIVDHRHGKDAITHWRVLARDSGAVRLSLRPETGRTHQLRVHCAAMGHPIVGDRLYGKGADRPRMLLHAERLAFDHPVSGARLALQVAAGF